MLRIRSSMKEHSPDQIFCQKEILKISDPHETETRVMYLHVQIVNLKNPILKTY